MDSNEQFEKWWAADENLWVHSRLTKLIAKQAFQKGIELGQQEGQVTAMNLTGFSPPPTKVEFNINI